MTMMFDCGCPDVSKGLMPVHFSLIVFMHAIMGHADVVSYEWHLDPASDASTS